MAATTNAATDELHKRGTTSLSISMYDEILLLLKQFCTQLGRMHGFTPKLLSTKTHGAGEIERNMVNFVDHYCLEIWDCDDLISHRKEKGDVTSLAEACNTAILILLEKIHRPYEKGGKTVSVKREDAFASLGEALQIAGDLGLNDTLIQFLEAIKEKCDEKKGKSRKGQLVQRQHLSEGGGLMGSGDAAAEESALPADENVRRLPPEDDEEQSKETRKTVFGGGLSLYGQMKKPAGKK